MRTAIGRLEARKAGESTDAIPTGYEELDRIIGGLRPAELTILAGRPSMGKSALAINILENIAIGRGTPFLFARSK